MLDLIENAGDRVIFQPEYVEDRDELFERVLRLYPDMRIEMDEAGNIELMAPGSMESGFGNTQVVAQLWIWADRDGTGLAFDSSVIYNLPNRAKMCPDASWIPSSIWAQHEQAARSKVTGVVVTPVFAVEVRSPSDRLKAQLDKCQRWMDAGVEETWLVDPIERTVHVFRIDRVVEVLINPQQVESYRLDGFVLNCARIWQH